LPASSSAFSAQAATHAGYVGKAASRHASIASLATMITNGGLYVVKEGQETHGLASPATTRSSTSSSIGSSRERSSSLPDPYPICATPVSSSDDPAPPRRADSASEPSAELSAEMSAELSAEAALASSPSEMPTLYVTGTLASPGSADSDEIEVLGAFQPTAEQLRLIEQAHHAAAQLALATEEVQEWKQRTEAAIEAQTQQELLKSISRLPRTPTAQLHLKRMLTQINCSN